MRILICLLLLVAAAAWPATARAQCSVEFDPVTVSQPYNPVSPNDYIVNFNVTARAIGLSLDMEYSALLLRQPLDTRPYQLFVINDDGSGAPTNIINTPPGPLVREGLNDSGEIDLNFGISLGLPTWKTFEMQLRIPAGTDLTPGSLQARFDVKYACDFLLLPTSRGTVTQGFTLNLSVSNALQALLVGAQPDFDEIGHLSTAAVAVAPLATTERRHTLRVASSGPYELRVTSQNGWRMTATGAPTSNNVERITYRYELLGQRLDSTTPNFTPVRCRTSGTTGQNIPLIATLTEGGQGKTASPTYRDTITITLTPLAVGTSGTVPCP